MLQRVGTYERRVEAPLPRAWENVRDWEHLPFLHRGSFSSIDLIEQGAFGWRARIGLAAGSEIVLELVIDASGERYVSRTLEGPGAGSEIWTTLGRAPAGSTPGAGSATLVAVDFKLADVSEGAAPQLGAAYRALYTRLWDEDEAMMRGRDAALLRRLARPEVPAVRIELGTLAALKERLPLLVDEGGRRVRVIERRGKLIAHDAVCPHWLGPLDEAAIEDGAHGELVCPWHGYRFDLGSGRSCDGRRLRLASRPRIEVDPVRQCVALVWESR